jgi:maltooligosyltrehalose trehalohydrolase
VNWGISLGAMYLGEGRCQFRVWAPLSERVAVRIEAPSERIVTLEKDGQGYHHAIVQDVEPGSLYTYRLDDGKPRPDPASRSQPQGVHGPSQVDNPRFAWDDRHWFGLPFEDYIIYELHVGTFTAEETFDAIIPHLDALKDLGITAVELMPVAQFPGNRNWGYDGVYPFAVQNSYGGPEGLRRLVNACHERGLAVVLDVVYNHLGPEGNYLGDFGPYFTERYRTPWGAAINFDGPYSDGVKRFFIENALYWITEFHVDALRLDALHAILDMSAHPFLEQLATAVREQAERIGRRVYLIAESDLNDTKLIRSQELGGYGLDAQWNDDFHHAIHTVLTGERDGYYRDFGKIAHLGKAFAEGYIYSGQYSAYRRRQHGNSSKMLAARQFVVCSQNHDQVGNRMFGERLSQFVSFDALKVAAGVVLLSPFIPLLFMGEEYGEPAPFLYFVSHSDPELVEAVRRGRAEEFAAFAWKGEPPDPQDEATFLQAKLNHKLRHERKHKVLLEFYKELIRLRNTLPSLRLLSKDQMEVTGYEREKVMCVRRWNGDNEALTIFHFGESELSATLQVPAGHWRRTLDSSEERWQGSGSSLPDQLASEGEVTLRMRPKAFAVFLRTEGA